MAIKSDTLALKAARCRMGDDTDVRERLETQPVL